MVLVLHDHTRQHMFQSLKATQKSELMILEICSVLLQATRGVEDHAADSGMCGGSRGGGGFFRPKHGLHTMNTNFMMSLIH